MEGGALVREGETARQSLRQAQQAPYLVAFGEATAGGRKPARRRPQQPDRLPIAQGARQVTGAEDFVIVVSEQEQCWPSRFAIAV
jgi:hypothetical protein